MVLALLMLSDGTSEVSMVPGSWASITWARKLFDSRVLAKMARKRRYWPPMLFDRLAHSGFSGSAGGLSGCGAMWQKPQLMPTRKGDRKSTRLNSNHVSE